jgi:hypothetical protein
MNTPFTLGAVACALLLLASCASPIQHRIERNPDLYGRLNAHQKEMVQHGAIEEGMGKEAVFLAWGKPDRVSNGGKMGKSYARWSYAGFDPVFYGPYAPGYGPWIYDPYYNLGPAISYLPYEERWAEFLNNHVSAWSITK